MIRLPPDLPDRFLAANEVHARPFDPAATPSRASYLAVLVDAPQRAAELAHLGRLCERYGEVPPAEGITQFALRFGTNQLKWERHGEFSTYIVSTPGEGTRPFSEPAIEQLPQEWLAAVPGQTIIAANAALVPAPAGGLDRDLDALLATCFGDATVVGSAIGDGAGAAFTDFRLQPDGFQRFLLIDGQLTASQSGRMLQRLFEIEAYRVLALLSLPIARRVSPGVVRIEQELVTLTEEIAREERADETLLGELTALAARVENALAATQFRFGASRAYFDLVRSRIAELREQRLPGLQTIDEFMARRLSPAMATCASLTSRLQELSQRVNRTSNLLSTRVNIVRERQNQALLASMDRRARLQLRLQQTVEGLSVVAISYYMVGLVHYLALGVTTAGLPVRPELLTGLAVPVVALGVALTVRWVRVKAVGHAPTRDEPRPGAG
ncbi:MAG: DUF3422 family protein [Pseudomonadota bacterium]|jgi:uncharacterized membrane-anchored protein